MCLRCACRAVVVQLNVTAQGNHNGTTDTTREFGRATIMSRIRRYLVPALLLLPVIFVCGKLLLTPVKAAFGPERLPKNYSGIMGSGLLGPREVGWPWVYRKTTDGIRR
jgi:hypothetical protein